jgi:PST family polysaccharide transporter/teichuronic acid exporter
VGNPVGSLIYAVGRTRMAFWWNVGLLVAMPPALWLGATLGGLEGLAWAMLISHACIFIPMWQFLVRPSCGAAFGEYLGQLLPPLLLALSAGAVAALVALAAATPTARLAVGLSSGLGLYVALSYRFNRPWVEAMRTLLLHPRLLAARVSEGRS